MANLSFLQKFTKGNTSKMKRYISMYLKIAPETFARMNRNVEEKNWKDLAINAHSLKPQAEYMGLLDLKELLIQIENKIKSGQTSPLPSIYQKAFQAHQTGEQELKKVLQQL